MMPVCPPAVHGTKERKPSMIETDYKPSGVCARNIHVVLSDDG